MRIVQGIGAFGLAMFLLAGCQQQHSAAPTTAKVEPIKVEQMLLGPEAAGGALTPPTTDKPLAVSISTSGTARDAQLLARLIRLSDGQTVAQASKKVTFSGPGVTALEFSAPTGWNAGRHLVEVTIDGRLGAQRDVDFVTPEQVAPAAAGSAR